MIDWLIMMINATNASGYLVAHRILSWFINHEITPINFSYIYHKGTYLATYKVVPHSLLIWFIIPISRVYGGYIYT